MEQLHDNILSGITRYFNEYSIVLLLTSKQWNKNINSTDCATPSENQKQYIFRNVKAFCQNGYTNLLKWFKLNFDHSGVMFSKEDNNTACYQKYYIEEAVKGGHLNTVIWLLQENCNNSMDGCWTASEYGHLDILKWIINQGYVYDILSCLYIATRNRHIEIIEYLKRL